MTLNLPADVEPFLTDDHEWTDPAVYALELERPPSLDDAWHEVFDADPSYMEELKNARHVVYVGAASNLMSRLEDHRNGDVRKSALMEVCDIESLRNVWWFDDADRAFERENGIAMTMQNEHPEYYVHSR